MDVTLAGYLWNNQGIFLREIFPNILGIYHGNVPRIFREHILGLGSNNAWITAIYLRPNSFASQFITIYEPYFY